MSNETLLEILCDRLEGYELAELLELSVRDIFYEFKDKIEEKLDEIKEVLEISDDERDDE
jgi:hypothetical protein